MKAESQAASSTAPAPKAPKATPPVAIGASAGASAGYRLAGGGEWSCGFGFCFSSFFFWGLGVVYQLLRANLSC